MRWSSFVPAFCFQRSMSVGRVSVLRVSVHRMSVLRVSVARPRDFFASSLRSLRPLREIGFFHAKLANEERPKNVGEPRARLVGCTRAKRPRSGGIAVGFSQRLDTSKTSQALAQATFGLKPGRSCSHAPLAEANGNSRCASISSAVSNRTFANICE